MSFANFLHYLAILSSKQLKNGPQNYFQNIFSFPLLFSFNPLPLHSKLKNGSKKFFLYVTENQNKIAVLRP